MDQVYTRRQQTSADASLRSLQRVPSLAPTPPRAFSKPANVRTGQPTRIAKKQSYGRGRRACASSDLQQQLQLSRLYKAHPKTITMARIVSFSHRSTTCPSIAGSQHAAEPTYNPPPIFCVKTQVASDNATHGWIEGHAEGKLLRHCDFVWRPAM